MNEPWQKVPPILEVSYHPAIIAELIRLGEEIFTKNREISSKKSEITQKGVEINEKNKELLEEQSKLADVLQQLKMQELVAAELEKELAAVKKEAQMAENDLKLRISELEDLLGQLYYYIY